MYGFSSKGSIIKTIKINWKFPLVMHEKSTTIYFLNKLLNQHCKIYKNFRRDLLTKIEIK